MRASELWKGKTSALPEKKKKKKNRYKKGIHTKWKLNDFQLQMFKKSRERRSEASRKKGSFCLSLFLMHYWPVEKCKKKKKKKNN